jgi:hypothetical protein
MDRRYDYARPRHDVIDPEQWWQHEHELRPRHVEILTTRCSSICDACGEDRSKSTIAPRGVEVSDHEQGVGMVRS